MALEERLVNVEGVEWLGRLAGAGGVLRIALDWLQSSHNENCLGPLLLACSHLLPEGLILLLLYALLLVHLSLSLSFQLRQKDLGPLRARERAQSALFVRVVEHREGGELALRCGGRLALFLRAT